MGKIDGFCVSNVFTVDLECQWDASAENGHGFTKLASLLLRVTVVAVSHNMYAL